MNKTETLAFFEPLTSSYVLILIAKVKLNVLYKAVYLSKSIRPNKDPKIESQKSSKCRLSPSLSFTLFESQIQTSNATLHCEETNDSLHPPPHPQQNPPYDHAAAQLVKIRIINPHFKVKITIPYVIRTILIIKCPKMSMNLHFH